MRNVACVLLLLAACAPMDRPHTKPATTGGRVLEGSGGSSPYSNLTLRDYFACQAMGALYPAHIGDPDRTAAAVYRMADAMLAERDK